MIPTTLGAVADITGGRLHGCSHEEAAAILGRPHRVTGTVEEDGLVDALEEVLAEFA